MGNQIEYECEIECHYWEIMHKVGDYKYREKQFEKCAHCTKPIRERLLGHGIYKEI